MRQCWRELVQSVTSHTWYEHVIWIWISDLDHMLKSNLTAACLLWSEMSYVAPVTTPSSDVTVYWSTPIHHCSQVRTIAGRHRPDLQEYEESSVCDVTSCTCLRSCDHNDLQSLFSRCQHVRLCSTFMKHFLLMFHNKCFKEETLNLTEGILSWNRKWCLWRNRK